MNGLKMLLMTTVLSGILGQPLSFAWDGANVGVTATSGSGEVGLSEGRSTAAIPIPEMNSDRLNHPLEGSTPLPAAGDDADSNSTVLALPALNVNSQDEFNYPPASSMNPSDRQESLLELPNRNLGVSTDFQWVDEARVENRLISPPGDQFDGIPGQPRQVGNQDVGNWRHARVRVGGPTTDSTSVEDGQWSTLPFDSTDSSMASPFSSTPSALGELNASSATNSRLDKSEGFHSVEADLSLQGRSSGVPPNQFTDGFGQLPQGLQLPSKTIQPRLERSSDADEVISGMITQTFSDPKMQSESIVPSDEISIGRVTTENTEGSARDSWEAGSVFAATGEPLALSEQQVPSNDFDSITRQPNSLANSRIQGMGSINPSQGEFIDSQGTARRFPENAGYSVGDTVEADAANQSGRNGYEAGRVTEPQSFLPGLLLVSLISNIYLIFWLKRLRTQFRDLLTTKRIANHG